MNLDKGKINGSSQKTNEKQKENKDNVRLLTSPAFTLIRWGINPIPVEPANLTLCKSFKI